MKSYKTHQYSVLICFDAFCVGGVKLRAKRLRLNSYTYWCLTLLMEDLSSTLLVVSTVWRFFKTEFSFWFISLSVSWWNSFISRPWHPSILNILAVGTPYPLPLGAQPLGFWPFAASALRRFVRPRAAPRRRRLVGAELLHPRSEDVRMWGARAMKSERLLVKSGF